MAPSPGKQGLAYYRAHFRETLQDDGVVCLECGKLRKALGTHVLMHDMTLDDYREKWGFNRKTVFVAPSTAALLRRIAFERGIGADASAEKMAMVRAARRAVPRRPEARLRLSESKKRLYASGWQPRRHRKAEDETLRRLARTSVDVKRIAQATGLSVDRTRMRLQALGLLPPARRRWKVDRSAILALRRRGLWPLEIAGRLGIQPQLVKKILWQFRKQGVTVPTPSRPRPTTTRRPPLAADAFLRAYRGGGTTAEIAERLGVSRQYVVHKTWQLRRRGVIPPVPRDTGTPASRPPRPASAPAACRDSAPAPAPVAGGSA